MIQFIAKSLLFVFGETLMEEKNTPKVNSGFYIDIHTAIHDENNNPNIFPNFHKNFEILIVLNGNCTCDINGQKFSAKKDEAIFIFPFQLHSLSLEKDSSVRRITFHHHLVLTIYQALEGKVPRSPVFHLSKSLLDMSVSFMNNEFGQDSGPISRIAPFEKECKPKVFSICLGVNFSPIPS